MLTSLSQIVSKFITFALLNADQWIHRLIKIIVLRCCKDLYSSPNQKKIGFPNTITSVSSQLIIFRTDACKWWRGLHRMCRFTAQGPQTRSGDRAAHRQRVHAQARE